MGEVDDVGDVDRSMVSVGRGPCQVPVGAVKRSLAYLLPCRAPMGDVE